MLVASYLYYNLSRSKGSALGAIVSAIGGLVIPRCSSSAAAAPAAVSIKCAENPDVSVLVSTECYNVTLLRLVVK